MISTALVMVAAFFLPLGTAPMKLALWLGVILGLPLLIRHWAELRRSPVAFWALGLFLWLALSSLWSPAGQEEIEQHLSRYVRLALIAVLALSIAQTYRLRGWLPERLMEAFVLGALVSATITWVTAFGLPHWLAEVPPDQTIQLGGQPGEPWITLGSQQDPNFGYTYISAGAFLIFAGNWVMARWKSSGLKALTVAFLVLPVFLMQGRTGYLLALISVVYWVVYFWRVNGVRQGFVAMACTGTVSLGIFLALPHVEQRVTLAVGDVLHYIQTGRDDGRSQAIRMEFWGGAVALVEDGERYLQGVGVGGYRSSFEAMFGRPVPEPSGQPHSEFLLLLSQGGLVGLALYLGLLIALFRACSDRPGLPVLVVLLGIDGLFNSVIWNMEEGHWVMFFCAALAANQITPAGVPMRVLKPMGSESSRVGPGGRV